MKNLLLIICLILTLVSCLEIEHREYETFVESKPSFFDLRNGDVVANKWIRDPENLIMIHETLKKFNYMNLIDESVFDEDYSNILGVFINKNILNLVDSLILTYERTDIDVIYYREFWERRIYEQNDIIVYGILKDWKQYTISDVVPQCHEHFVNDTLLRLLEVEFGYDSLTDAVAIQNFNTLVKYGFHQSAYNLLYERPEYDKVNWDRNELSSKLNTADKYTGAWLIDNNK